MALIRRTKPTNSYDEMNRLMESFFARPWLAELSDRESSITTELWAPTVNISETDQEFKVFAELPGVKEDDIDLSFHDNALFIRGEKKFEKKEEKENFHRVESSYGSFQRTIPFTSPVDAEKVSAEFQNGVLNVKLGKKTEGADGPKKINIIGFK